MDLARVAELAELQQAFLNAPFEEDGWTTALRLLARATQSSRAQLIGLGPSATLFNFMTDIDPGYEREFRELEAHRPDVNWRVAVSGRPLEILSERHYDAARAVGNYDIYEEHARKWGGSHGCQTALVEDSHSFVGLAVLRDDTDGRTSSTDRRVFAAGAQHALAAIKMQRSMADRGAALLAGTLETMGLAAFLLDGRGQVAALTADAEALLSGPGAHVLSLRAGQITALARGANSMLQRAIGDALNPMIGGGPTRELWLKSAKTGELGVRCELHRLPRREFSFGFEARVLMVVNIPADLPERRLLLARDALGLTAAEGEVMMRLVQGVDRTQVAIERGTSPQTINTQIKSILQKASVSREAELVALVNRLTR